MVSPSSNANYLRQAESRGVNIMTNLAIREAVNGVTSEITGAAAKAMVSFAKVLEKEYSNRKTRMAQVNETVGLGAQKRTVASYSARVNQNNTPAYRATASGKFKRYAGGKMLQALEDPGFYRASWDGLLFGNGAVMDRKAKQWYRLNFGAGPRGNSGQYKAKEYRMKFFGAAVGAPITLKGNRPSRQYNLPKGFFVGAAGGKAVKLGASRGDIFVPVKSSSAKTVKRKVGGRVPTSNIWKGGPSQGFGGFHFLDAGVAHITKTWPAANIKMLQDWVEEATKFGTGPIAKIAVPAKSLAIQRKALEAEIKLATTSGKLVDFR